MKLDTSLISVRRWPLLEADRLDPRLNRLYLLTYRVRKPAPPVVPRPGIRQTFAYVARPAVGARWHLVRFGSGP
jgi:hypothetical protein